MQRKQEQTEKSPKTVRENGLLARIKSDLTVFGNVRALCVCAMLAAMSLILEKFLQIPNPFQEIIRISFGNLPLILSGLVFGPFMGAMTGAVADLLGCALYGYPINPLITLGAASVGFVAGIVANYLLFSPRWDTIRIVLATVDAHFVGSVLIKSFGLAAWYLGSYDMGFIELVLWRLLTYTIVGTAECVLLCILLRHRAITSLLERIRKK
ncbi:MAG: folate family ECF transporter S component [Clostridia bacterium]|nr:folate family ECF transporter S component [Clostridia bacterium]